MIDCNGNVVCGTLIVELPLAKGLNQIPVVRLEGLTPEQLRLYAIAANRLADMAGYDDTLLADQLRELGQLIELPDMHGLGFEDGELDRLLGLTTLNDPDDEDPVEINEQDPPITQLGDLWLLGPHRMYCSDALKWPSYTALMAEELAHFVLSEALLRNRPCGIPCANRVR